MHHGRRVRHGLVVTSCHDEKVIYFIRTISGKPDLMFVRADKIVDGKAITMGTGEWQYDRAKLTPTMRSPQRLWLLRRRAQIEGTLTLADGTVFRKMKLRQDR